MQLKFVYDLVFMHADKLLRQRGIVPNYQPKSSPAASDPSVPDHTGTNTASGTGFDVFTSDGGLDQIRATVEKMTVRTRPPVPAATEVTARYAMNEHGFLFRI